MRVAFLLPCRSPVPVGGFKIVYEYANLLVSRGHEVVVVHPRTREVPSSRTARFKARLWVGWYRVRPHSIAPWFPVDRRVCLSAVACPRVTELPNVDALVATTWQTADWVAAAAPGKGRGFYLVQGYELDGIEEVRAAWRLPLHKVVISKWLEEIAIEMGEGPRTSRVPNGIDFDQWGVDLIEERRPIRVGALLSDKKGGEDILSALRMARATTPGLTAATFGTEAPPPGLPDWIEYVRLPNPAALRRLYNSCSIFLQASPTEGWGLPATESMACGCALVTYDTGGSREYAVDRRTALVVSRGAERLSDAIVELAGDRDLRLKLARQGREHVAGFTWPRSVSAIERVFAGAEPGGEDPLA